MTYLDDDYSLDDYPCFGTYELGESGCRPEKCKFYTACKAETGALSRMNNSYRKKVAIAPQKTALSVTKSLAQPQGLPSVMHADFTPYPGESIARRVAKNVILDAGTTVCLSLGQFLATFEWRPPQGPVAPLRVVERIDSDDDETRSK